MLKIGFFSGQHHICIFEPELSIQNYSVFFEKNEKILKKSCGFRNFVSLLVDIF
jgi:hypothetical protein